MFTMAVPSRTRSVTAAADASVTTGSSTLAYTGGSRAASGTSSRENVHSEA